MDFFQTHIQLTGKEVWKIDWTFHGEIFNKVSVRDKNLTNKSLKKTYTRQE